MIDLPKLALSIRQPWAWAILSAGKDVENRSWPTRFRGEVCVHAARGMTRAEYDDCLATCRAAAAADRLRDIPAPPARDRLELGGIIGTVEIVDCVSESDSPWFFGPHGFVLRNPRRVEFISVRGALGFFDWRPNVLPARAMAENGGRLL